ncbi:MAG: Na/Pi cotransporter family protein [Clostridia bacterium]|nr:Na/Pi cotransporter family protein [Clostridia bacterium]
MNSFLVILYNFIAGVICLIIGVNMMSSGLEKANPGIIKRILSKLTSTAPLALLTGTAVTALLQSSTAVTVITVGFVNSGMMKLSQAIGIIYGANIGTTITAQLMSFNLTNFALPIFIFGFLTKFFSPKISLKSMGNALMGFGLMFIGIGILNSGVPYIKDSEFAYNLFKNFGQNPFIGLLIGMVATMLVHSSSATVGLTIILFNSGLISFEAAIGLTLGDNIGTCITAQMASFGSSTAARRTAWAHTIYNIIGVLLAIALFTPFAGMVRYITSTLGQDSTRLIANTHTIFNILSAAVFLPFTGSFIKLIEKLIPGRKEGSRSF